MKRLKLLWKWGLIGLGFGDSLIEFCHDCGQRQPLVWWASELDWKTYGRTDSGILCPRCFDKRATKQGVLLRWTPQVVNSPGVYDK